MNEGNPITSAYTVSETPEIMVDIETLGLTPRSVVVSIGAVAFNRRGNDTVSDFREYSETAGYVASRRAFYRVLDLGGQQKLGRDIDAGTVKWWATQAEAAKVLALDGYSVFGTVNAFRIWVNQQGGKRLWANPTTFDVPILESLFRDVVLPWPFSHRDYRDLKTLKDAAPCVTKSWPAELVAHNALDDAIGQALEVQEVYRHCPSLR